MPPGRSVAERVHEMLETLTPSERRAAVTLLAQYPMAGLESITRFARRSGVSSATIVRLLDKLGFSGYPEFQELLRGELAAQLQSPLGRWQEQSFGATAVQDFLGRFAEQVADNVRRTAAHLPRDVFDRVVGLLCDERRPVHVIGGRFTEHLAGYLVVHLRAARPRVRQITGQSAAWPDQALDVGRSDTVVTFDVRRYQPDVAAFTELAAGRGARVVLVTDEWRSPTAALADHVILTHTASPLGWDSLTALMAVVEALIGAVSDRLGDRFAGRLRELEEARAASRRPPADD